MRVIRGVGYLCGHLCMVVGGFATLGAIAVVAFYARLASYDQLLPFLLEIAAGLLFYGLLAAVTFGAGWALTRLSVDPELADRLSSRLFGG